MTDIRFRSDVTVQLVKHTAYDGAVTAAARVSTLAAESIDDLNADPIDDTRIKGLINYLMRDKHGSPYEHNSMTFFIQAPIFVFREFQRHRAGWCVAGDTEITTESWGEASERNTRQVRIDDLYERWHNGVQDSMGRIRHLPSVKAQKVRVLNEKSMHFELGAIADVIQSGEKEVHTFRTENGKTLRCTAEHRLFTNEGWVRAGDLEPDHLLTVVGKRPINPTRQVPPELRRGINVWTMMQRNTLIKPIDVCHVCCGRFTKDSLGMDHVIPVAKDLSRALDIDNLRPICKPCAKIKNADEQKLATRGNTSGGKFVRYERVGNPCIEMTYDLSVEGPWHNFLANGIVVHNSYNEESGRYKELEPVFYVPAGDRKLVQVGKPGAYRFEDGTQGQHDIVTQELCSTYEHAYHSYQEMLAAGVAREVARMALPTGIYSSMYATCNARSLMHFLGLRTIHSAAKVPSFPQREIEMVAEKMEAEWARLMPLTHAAFNANGRVAP